MKGIELPISTIIVIILVLIVLLAIVGLFYGVWPSGSQVATLESAKSNACQMLTSINGCKSTDDGITKTIAINNFDADQDGTNDPGVTTTSTCKAGTLPALPAELNTKDSLFMLCKCWYNIGGADKDINDNCKTQVCGCST
jgi:hypothetical protein